MVAGQPLEVPSKGIRQFLRHTFERKGFGEGLGHGFLPGSHTVREPRWPTIRSGGLLTEFLSPL